MKVFRNWAQRPPPSYVTVGNYDGVHLGHQFLLGQLKRLAKPEAARIVMTFEPHPLAVVRPGSAPNRITDLRTKLACLADCGITQANIMHFTHRFAQLSAPKFVQMLCERLNMCYLVVGSDFRFGSGRSGDTQLLGQLSQKLGFGLEIVADRSVDGLRVSSKMLRMALADGDMDRTCRCLGRPYRICGRIVAGDKIGRQLGFPTANLGFTGEVALRGVFAAFVHMHEQVWPAALSVGYRPTVGANRLNIEAHLIGFADNIYGERICVEPVRKLRDERSYPNMSDLSAAIAEDVRHCQRVLATYSKRRPQRFN